MTASPLPAPLLPLRILPARTRRAPVRTPAEVLVAVAAQYGVDVAALREPTRTRWIVAARTDAARRLRAMGLSLKEIGGMLARDHSTVYHMLKKGGRP